MYNLCVLGPGPGPGFGLSHSECEIWDGDGYNLGGKWIVIRLEYEMEFRCVANEIIKHNKHSERKIPWRWHILAYARMHITSHSTNGEPMNLLKIVRIRIQMGTHHLANDFDFGNRCGIARWLQRKWLLLPFSTCRKIVQRCAPCRYAEFDLLDDAIRGGTA